ncbi:MAG: AbrB/MazE/SpoVT family DNA-binding domain-containing protein [Gaiellales bacterium]
MVRHVDELGRIVIPVEIRKRFGIKMRDPLEITVRGDSVVLTKPRDTCVFCNGNRGLTEFRGRRVCGDCVNALIGDVIHA